MDHTSTFELTPCILWGKSLTSDGYGATTNPDKTAKTRSALAHRVAYMEAFGPIPDGLVVRHKCDNPPCVNPEHLELGTHADNVRDRMERGRDGHLKNNQCPSGHEYTHTNNKGARICRTCERAACKRWREKNKRDPKTGRKS